MPELFVPPQGGTDRFEVRISPALAMVLALPLVDLAARFPGIDPWLAQLPSRVGRAARADIRLLCVPLSGVMSYLLESPGDEESIQPALDTLESAPPEEVLARVLERLAVETEDAAPETLRRWIQSEPERIAAIISKMERPSSEDPFAIDVERVLTLLRRPAELKSMVTLRFRQLWYDHFGPRWQQALPLCRSLAEQARRHFYLDDPERVLEAVAGRSGREHLAPVLHKRIVFVPVPFIGPYISMAAGPDLPVSYVGFGVVKGARANGEAARRDLLAALKALADDARLHALAYIRDRGEARAADLMQQFGWSQPATSRHLRALESIGLLQSQRVDGVKRYTLDRDRARAIARSLEHFLTQR
nr:hypothetical protein [Bacillota bacterium]